MQLYHGTDRQSARKIEKNGIDLSAGREHLDFGQGFYMTDVKGVAKQWAQRNSLLTANNCAVLTFELDTNVIDIQRLDQDSELWNNVVYGNRISGIDTSSGDCIVGPIADGLMSEIIGADLTYEQFCHLVKPAKRGRQFVAKTQKCVSALKLTNKEMF